MRTDPNPISLKELIDKCKKTGAYINVMSPVPKSFFKEVTQLKVISTDVFSNAIADIAFLLMLNVSRKAFLIIGEL